MDEHPHQCTCLIFPTEQWLSSVHLYQNTAQTPHVDSQVVRDPQEHLRRPVKPALDIMEHLQERERERESCDLTISKDSMPFMIMYRTKS